MFKKWLFLIYLLPFAYSSYASIYYSEEQSGDLSLQNDGNWILFDAEEGANQVQGASIWGEGGFDADLFRFAIQEGMRLDSIQLDYNVDLGGALRLILGSPLINLDNGGYINTFYLIMLSNEAGSIAMHSAYIPLGAGEYILGFNSGGKAYYSQYPATTIFDYTFTLNVVQVPAPSTVLLFCSALIGLIGSRRYCRSSSL